MDLSKLVFVCWCPYLCVFDSMICDDEVCTTLPLHFTPSLVFSSLIFLILRLIKTQLLHRNSVETVLKGYKSNPVKGKYLWCTLVIKYKSFKGSY